MKSVVVLRTCWLVGFLTIVALQSRALAQVCFPPPAAVPGLPGAPDWSSAASTKRSDLDEPRWGAAPITSFASDVSGSLEGAYRALYDAAAGELVVSMQALTDLGGAASGADTLYFGFSTNAGATTAHAVRVDLIPPTGAADPKTLSSFTRYEYTVGGGWTTPDGVLPIATPPSWMVVPRAWVEPGSGADWGVNFRVNLVAAGLGSGDAFKIAFGLHIQDEGGAGSVDLTSPDVGVAGAVADLVTNPHTPTTWLSASAANGGCLDGIALNSMQIGTRNVAPNKFDTSPGFANTLFAAPTIPGSLAVLPNMFQANFRVAHWGSIADSHAPWTSVPAATAVINGTGSAPNLQTIEFTCPANVAGQTCGMPTPAEPHQCMLVELSKVPTSGATVRFTTAAAYRNMRFEDLSEITDRAEISVVGLKAVLGNNDPRQIYLYVDTANMPAHGDKPLWLQTRTMALARRIAEAPAPLVQQPRVAAAGGVRPTATLAVNAAAAPRLDRPIDALGYGNHQLLKTAWPTYEVHVYYELGQRKLDDKTTYLRLEPMYPFVYYFAHDGSLYGFTQRLLADATLALQELRPNLYKVVVPSEGAVHVAVNVRAEEAPKSAQTQPCPAITKVVVHKTCACSMLGRPGTGLGLETLAGLVLGLLIGVRVRARKIRCRRA
jgi:hypothetical protein